MSPEETNREALTLTSHSVYVKIYQINTIS